MATRKTTPTSLLNLQNLDDNAYLKNRLKYHAASRIGIQTNQSLAQATNGDGHTVRYGQVWSAKDNQFAFNTGTYKTTSNGIEANINLVSVFKVGATSEPFAYVGSSDTVAVTGKIYYSYNSEIGKYTKLTEGTDWNPGDSLVGKNYYENAGKGLIWTNASYPAIKLYEQCEMNTVSGSNGAGTKFEAYELTYNLSRVMDWVAPTAVKDNGLPVPGYTARIQAFKSNKWTDLENCTDGSGAWALAEGNWEFVYISGMCTFHPDNTPNGYSYTKLRITAFAYVGDYLPQTLNALEIGAIAVQPFEFNIKGMTTATFVKDSTYEKSGTNYVLTTDTTRQVGKEYFIIPSVTVSGSSVSTDVYVPLDSKYVVLESVIFNVFNDYTGVSYGDLCYLTGDLGGQTLIVFEKWDNAYFDGQTDFTGYGLVRGDGEPIDVLSPDRRHKQN